MSRASELMDSRKFMAAMDKLGNTWFPGERDAEYSDNIPDDAARAEALQAVLDMAMPSIIQKRDDPPRLVMIDSSGQDMPAGVIYPGKKPRGIKALIPVPEPIAEVAKKNAQVALEKNIISGLAKPKRKRRTKAEMAAARAPKAKPFNYDTATEAQVAAETERLAKAQITPEKAIADVIESAIKPHFATRAPGPDGFKHFVVFMSRPDGSNLSSNGTKWKDALNAAGCRATKVEMTLLNAGSRQFDLMVM